MNGDKMNRRDFVTGSALAAGAFAGYAQGQTKSAAPAKAPTQAKAAAPAKAPLK